MKKYLVLVALLTAGVVQADQLHWAHDVYTNASTTAWTNPNSWYNNTANAIATAKPVAADKLLIQEVVLGTQTPTTVFWPIVSTAETVTKVNMASSDAGISGQLNLISGANLTVTGDFWMGKGENTASTVNLSGNAVLDVGILKHAINATASSVINMSGTSLLKTGSAGDLGLGSKSITMDGGAVFQQFGDTSAFGWENNWITAVGAGDSIGVNYNPGGNYTEYTVIPEPATISMVALLGGGLLWIRKRFMI